MPNTIKVKRGKSAALNTSTEKLQAGEVLYNLDKNYLTVGAEDNDALTKKPVAAREIVGYTGDTDSKIGTSTTEAYSIRYNDDSGVIVSSENNILSTPGTLKMQTPGKNASTVIISTGEVDPDGSAKPTIELSTSLGMPITLALPWKSGTLATTDDITASASTKLDNTNEDKVALKNNKSLSYTSEATASTIMSRDANGRAKVADGVADKDIATVGQLNAGLNDRYTKPAGGIPKDDLSGEVQASLDKADSALQSHQSITTGSVNGTIAANGTDVAVKGLGSLAYKNALTKTDVGLGNVDNTSDEEKPISTATQAALDKKQASLTATQLNAVNSGITSGKVGTYDGYQAKIDDKYTKPTGGIPETDLAGDVQTSLAKANSALQSHQTVKLESGTNNGTLKLTVNGTATDNVAVTNLGSAAFTAASNYAAAADLENYYTKTESDGRYVKSVASTVNQYSVYAIGGNKDITVPLAENPDAQAVVQYNSAGTVRTNTPTTDLDAVNKKYGSENYFNKADTELTPITGDTISKEQIMDLGTGLYGIFSHKIYGLDISGYFNLEIFHSAAHRTYLLESSNSEMYVAQILNDTDRTFTGWVQIATTNYVDEGFVKRVTGSSQVYAKGSDGVDTSIGYSQSPANSAIMQYTSAGTVRTKAPIDNLDAVNKQYANRYYETLSCYNATLIPANANLDTYVTFGNYYANSAQGVTNLPDGITSSGNTLKLSVGAASDDVAAYQILYVWASNNGEFKGKYIRSTVGEGWNAWERFSTNKDKVFSVTIYEAGE